MFKIDKSVIEAAKKSVGYHNMFDFVSHSFNENKINLDNCCIEVTRIIDGKYVSELLIPEEYSVKYPISVEEKLIYDFENDYFYYIADGVKYILTNLHCKQLSQYSVDFQFKLLKVLYPTTTVYLEGYNNV